MKKYINKFIWLVGLLTIIAASYLSSFYVVSEYIIYPHERENILEAHYSRPIYNIVYYPLRWFKANGSSFKKETIKLRYGWLNKPNINSDEKLMRSAELKAFDDSYIFIGFTGETKLLESFDKIKYGQFLKMTFGVALNKESDSFINRLISYEVVELVDDPRIISQDLPPEEIKRNLKTLNKLKGSNKTCSNEFIKNYEEKVLKHCLQAGYAENIGGGCYHIVGYSINNSVIKKALEKCQGNI